MLSSLLRFSFLSAVATLAVAAVTAPALHAQASPTAEELGIPPAVKAAADSIDPERLRAHVKFLADDLLEGRGTGQRGGDIAAAYIASQFAQYGLKPAGDNGGYLQKVNFYGIRTDAAKTLFAFVKGPQKLSLNYLDDYISVNQTATAIADLDAPVVWLGYGIHAPEYGWDDYAGVDLHGKIALVLVNEPPSDDPAFFMGKTMTYYGRWTYKYEEVARHGALGVIVIHRTDIAGYPWTVLRSAGAIEHAELKDDPLNTLKTAGWITYDAAGKLFALAGLDRDAQAEAAGKRGFHAQELSGVRLNAHIASDVREFTSSNVVAQLPGANVASGQPDSAVIYTGHYDHLGLGTGTGDIIYNGAADNGTGSAIVIEMARAWATCKQQTAHSIFFAAVTAEEQGLLGSKYLGMHPPVPAKQISLDLNFDELLPIGDAASANVSGAERTDFYPVVEKIAAAYGLTLQPDGNPQAGHYYRSDHFSFARVGIPAFSVGEGTLFAGHDQAWGEAQENDYTEHHYHQVSDEYSPSMDFRGNARLSRFGFVLGWLASEQPGPVQWRAGDEFEAARKH